MEGYERRVKRSAVKELERLGTKADRRSIVRRIADLAAHPRPSGASKLGGREAYRIRQGDFRVVYTVDDEARIMEVVGIAHRRDAYGP